MTSDTERKRAVRKVMVALSGGVDSGAAAALLIEAGYEVIGCYGIMCNPELHGNEKAQLTHEQFAKDTRNLSTSDQRIASYDWSPLNASTPPDIATVPAASTQTAADIEAAEQVARTLGIPFHVVDLRVPFARHVIAPFCESYARGLTPSPCVDCNRHIKFGALLREAQRLGCSHIATGHYARIVERAGHYELHKALDTRKDQSYMLARLTPEQLAHTLLPLGALTKDDARTIARTHGLPNAQRSESQDICFVPDGDHVAFTERFLQTRFEPGDFIDTRGTVLGQHEGIAHYTVGQRKGIGLAFGEPRYVCALDAQANTVTIGTREELRTHTVSVRDVSWTEGAAPAPSFECTAKIRYRQAEQSARAEVHVAPTPTPTPTPTYASPIISPCETKEKIAYESAKMLTAETEPSTEPEPKITQGDSLTLYFAEPQSAVAPGQYAVLYDGTRVLGSGIIA